MSTYAAGESLVLVLVVPVLGDGQTTAAPLSGANLVFKDTLYRSIRLRHQVLADEPRGVGEAIGKPVCRRVQQQAGHINCITGNHHISRMLPPAAFAVIMYAGRPAGVVNLDFADHGEIPDFCSCCDRARNPGDQSDWRQMWNYYTEVEQALKFSGPINYPCGPPRPRYPYRAHELNAAARALAKGCEARASNGRKRSWPRSQRPAGGASVRVSQLLRNRLLIQCQAKRLANRRRSRDATRFNDSVIRWSSSSLRPSFVHFGPSMAPL